MTSTPTTDLHRPTLSSDEALRIARADAEKAYRDLHLYRIEIELRDDGWHVDFQFKDEASQSGGPHYLIDAADGRCVWKRYEQ